ncbi:hypothetical protein ACP4OV_030477 [Aristida adscensionis]
MTGAGAGAAAAPHAYGEAWYWDERYRTEAGGPSDWYQNYAALALLLRLYLAPHHRLLLVGCGNSVFGENMVDDGYQDIVNIDISPVHLKMDVKNMSDFESESFDAVFDKGTLDSIMCGQNSQENATKMLKEVNRILKVNGVYILITYGDPSYRLRSLKDMQHWAVKLHAIDRYERSSNQNKWEVTKPLPLDDASLVAVLGQEPDVHYIYVCVKATSIVNLINQRVPTDFTLQLL